uniref:G_PROTEIN_RECEP_F1_2 domain-containing protein n=1 Tax=Meloidogyne hapla TaxID=6305 RepID=A0A1I8B7A2_MELHA
MLIAYCTTFVYIRFFFGHQNRVRATTHQSSIRSLARDKEEERIQKARRQREKNFLVQSFLICGFLEIQNLAFVITPAIFASLKGQWPFLVTFAENWISILLNSISPIILFSFNGDVRKSLAELFKYQPQCCFGPQIINQNNNLPIAFTQSFTVPPSQLLRPLGLNRRITDENNNEQISRGIDTPQRQISLSIDRNI